MITVPQAARRVHRNPETIRRWIRDGRLAAERVGTQYLVDEAVLDSLVGGPDLAPSRFDRTLTGEPMPDMVSALARSRSGR